MNVRKPLSLIQHAYPVTAYTQYMDNDDQCSVTMSVCVMACLSTICPS